MFRKKFFLCRGPGAEGRGQKTDGEVYFNRRDHSVCRRTGRRSQRMQIQERLRAQGSELRAEENQVTQSHKEDHRGTQS